MVFSDKTLIHMCILKPGNEEEMLNVTGVGRHKYEKVRKKVYRRGEKSVGNILLPSENEERNVLKFLAF